MKIILALGCLLMLFTALPLAFAQEDLEGRYSSYDGVMTFSYPADWDLEEFRGLYWLNPEDELFTGVIQMGDEATRLQYGLPDDATADDFMDAVLAQFQRQPDSISLDAVQTTTIGDYPAQVVTAQGSIGGIESSMWVAVLTLEDGSILIGNAVTNEEGVDINSYLPSFQAVLASIRLHRPPSVEVSTLDAISPENAAQLVQIGLLHPQSFAILNPVVAFAPDNRFAALLDGSDISLVDPASGETLQLLAGESEHLLYDLAISPDAALIVGAFGSPMGGAGALQGWDSASGETRYFSEEPGNLRRVAFTPDGAYVVASTWSGEILILNAADGVQVSGIRGSEDASEIHLLAISPDGSQIVVGDQNSAEPLRVYNALTGELLYVPAELAASPYAAVAFTPDGSYLVGAAQDATAEEVSVWQAADGSLAGRFDAFDAPPSALAISPDGSLIALGSKEGLLRFFAADGELLAEQALVESYSLGRDFYAIDSLDFNPAGTLLAVYGHDDTLRLFAALP